MCASLIDDSPAEPLQALTRAAGRYKTLNDYGLVELSRGGDQRAFAELVHRYEARAQRVALGLLKNEQDACEVVQEAFLRVHRRLGSYEGSASFFTWLYRIVTNLSIDLLRKPARQEARDNVSEEEAADWGATRVPEGDPFELICRAELLERVQHSIQRLPTYHRGVIIMRELRGLSYEEMAQEMGVSKGTIMSRLHHARQKLQRSLAPIYRERFQTEEVLIVSARSAGRTEVRAL